VARQRAWQLPTKESEGTNKFTFIFFINSSIIHAFLWGYLLNDQAQGGYLSASVFKFFDGLLYLLTRLFHSLKTCSRHHRNGVLEVECA